MAGRLYVVGTPIGNLEDITLRAVRVLGEVAAIACEDTRQTVKILNRYGLKKPLISYFHPRKGGASPRSSGLLKDGPGRRPRLGRGDARNLRSRASLSSAKPSRRVSPSSPSPARRP